MRDCILRLAYCNACLAVALLCFLLEPSASRADLIENFFHGKTINLYVSSSAGNGYDIYARLVARFLGNHIPGNPTVVPINMAGAEGRVAAGYVYNAVAKDGLSLVALNRSVALDQVMNGANPQFDIAKFNWIGDPDSDNSTLATWYTSGVATIEEARQKEVTIGATGTGNSAIYPMIMNAVLGTRFKIIRGYPGGAEIDLAMEKGEVGGRGDDAWGSWKSGHPDWLRDHKINIVVQIGLKKAPDLPNTPLLSDLAGSADDRTLLKLISAPDALGHPIATSPAVPEERVAALQAAFDATIADPSFQAAADQQRRAINATSGKALASIVSDILSTPQPIRDRLVALVGKPGEEK